MLDKYIFLSPFPRGAFSRDVLRMGKGAGPADGTRNPVSGRCGAPPSGYYGPDARSLQVRPGNRRFNRRRSSGVPIARPAPKNAASSPDCASLSGSERRKASALRKRAPPSQRRTNTVCAFRRSVPLILKLGRETAPREGGLMPASHLTSLHRFLLSAPETDQTPKT
jgi:hypothetical protein